MPIYEFMCKTCGSKFEQLSPLEWQGKINCAQCGSEILEKLVSSFSSPGHQSSSCGGCAGKNCGSCH